MNLKDLSSLSTFKKHIISNFNISRVPSYYIMGNRYSSVIHARFRNNNDLFRNHVRDNPLCEWCGVMEDATRFFFHSFIVLNILVKDRFSMIQLGSFNPKPSI